MSDLVLWAFVSTVQSTLLTLASLHVAWHARAQSQRLNYVRPLSTRGWLR